MEITSYADKIGLAYKTGQLEGNPPISAEIVSYIDDPIEGWRDLPPKVLGLAIQAIKMGDVESIIDAKGLSEKEKTLLRDILQQNGIDLAQY